MAVDLGTVLRAVGGTLVAHGYDERTPVDGVARIAEYVVAPQPGFATLVTGDTSSLLTRLAAESRGESPSVLARAVLVTTEDTAALRKQLDAYGMTAVLGAEPVPSALHARLAALIAEAQSADDRLVAAGTKVLTQVARRGGATAVIAELAHRIDGWAVLIDANGHLIASAGAGRLHVADATAVALGRPVRVRHPGLQTHQVGSDRDLAGYLVIASRSSVTSRNRDLASQAAALFDLLLRTRDPSVTEHLGRQALLGILLGGGAEAGDLLYRWGVRDAHLTAFELGSRTRSIDLERLATRWLDDLGLEHVFDSAHGRIRGFIPDEAVSGLVRLATAATPLGGASLHLGIGCSASVSALARSAAQARQALDTAFDDGRRLVHFADLPTVGVVLNALGADRTPQIAGVLDGLRDASGRHGELTETLRVFLSTHGAQRASAAQLGIHRQTLMARIRQVEVLTGLSMDRPDDRAIAWLAMRALAAEA